MVTLLLYNRDEMGYVGELESQQSDTGNLIILSDLSTLEHLFIHRSYS